MWSYRSPLSLKKCPKYCSWLKLVYTYTRMPQYGLSIFMRLARKRRGDAPLFSQYLRATNGYKLSDPVQPPTPQSLDDRGTPWSVVHSACPAGSGFAGTAAGRLVRAWPRTGRRIGWRPGGCYGCGRCCGARFQYGVPGATDGTCNMCHYPLDAPRTPIW